MSVEGGKGRGLRFDSAGYGEEAGPAADSWDNECQVAARSW